MKLLILITVLFSVFACKSKKASPPLSTTVPPPTTSTASEECKTLVGAYAGYNQFLLCVKQNNLLAFVTHAEEGDKPALLAKEAADHQSKLKVCRDALAQGYNGFTGEQIQKMGYFYYFHTRADRSTPETKAKYPDLTCFEGKIQSDNSNETAKIIYNHCAQEAGNKALQELKTQFQCQILTP